MSTVLSDLASAGVLAAGLPPNTITSSPTGPSIDLVAADGPCFAIQHVGDLAEDTSLHGRIEESATGSSWSAIPGAAFTPVTTANTLQVICFSRTARYVRYVADLTGETPSAHLAVVIGEQRKTL
jgi:hypothetical protein